MWRRGRQADDMDGESPARGNRLAVKREGVVCYHLPGLYCPWGKGMKKAGRKRGGSGLLAMEM